MSLRVTRWAVAVVFLLIGAGLPHRLALAVERPVPSPFPSAPPFTISPWHGYTATIVTSLGEIVLALDTRAAPIAVNNFIFLAQQHFYDSLSFQRVVPGFLAQAGAPNRDGSGGPGFTIPDEDSPLRHDPGAIAMALSSVTPNSGGSQFYICLAPIPDQDGRDPVFGRVVQGLDLLQGLPRRIPSEASQGDDAGLIMQTITITPSDELPAAAPTASSPRGAAADGPLDKKAPPFLLTPDTTYTATLRTDHGDIVIALDAQAAPLTVNNFIFLAEQHFYDGLTWHRVIPGFVAQSGDPSGSGSGGPGYTIPDEPSGLLHDAGALAMAKASQPNTAGSQFYLTLTPQHALDGTYTVFGHVISGLDVAQALMPRNPAADLAAPSGEVLRSVTIAQEYAVRAAAPPTD